MEQVVKEVAAAVWGGPTVNCDIDTVQNMANNMYVKCLPIPFPKALSQQQQPDARLQFICGFQWRVL